MSRLVVQVMVDVTVQEGETQVEAVASAVEQYAKQLRQGTAKLYDSQDELENDGLTVMAMSETVH